MKVSLFFDGKNFYSGWRDTGDERRIDFVKLADWICKKVGGRFIGASYYTEEGPENLSSFLDMLSHQRGYFVKSFKQQSHTSGKKTAIQITCDALMSPADMIVILSGDGDLTSLIKALRNKGRIAYVASWSGAGLSGQLRRAAFDHINLTEGLDSFGSDEPPEQLELPEFVGTASDEDSFMEELERAEEHFDGRYVGLSYFVSRWRSDTLTSSPEQRRQILDKLIDDGAVEVYDAPDGNKAIRIVLEEEEEVAEA